MVSKGDVVRVLRKRNAFDDDVSKCCTSDISIGDTFVVGEVESQEVSGYPCDIVYPENADDGWFWREDDLEVVPPTPVRTVTRKEIVPGTYGDVGVSRVPLCGVEISYKRYANAASLRAAAATFIELADALEEV